MCYLYHHPHVPIMYLGKAINRQNVALQNKFVRAQSEIKATQKLQKPSMEAGGGGGADLVQDIIDCRFTITCIHKWGEAAFSSQCVKQPTKQHRSQSLVSDPKKEPCYIVMS